MILYVEKAEELLHWYFLEKLLSNLIKAMINEFLWNLGNKPYSKQRGI